jgi:3-oxoacyl-[acyl-carrier-protein] synthase-1
MRANLSRFEETAFDDARGQPIIAAPAIEAVQGRQGHERLIPLMLLAVAECIEGAGADPAEALRTVPCLIVVDGSDRPDLPPDLEQTLLAALRSGFATPLHPLSRVIARGATGFLEVMARARAALSPQMPSCLIVAVDSLINRRMLQALEAARRLKTPDNSDGVIPGEAAAALWVAIPGHGNRSMARILGIGLAEEPSVADPRLANKAEGLAAAMSGALADAGLALHEVDLRVGGLTGERLGFVEASTALARIQKVHKDDFLLWAPADQLGDAGVALCGCMIVATTMGLLKHYAPGPTAIVYCLSPDGRRAACIVAAARD